MQREKADFWTKAHVYWWKGLQVKGYTYTELMKRPYAT